MNTKRIDVARKRAALAVGDLLNGYDGPDAPPFDAAITIPDHGTVTFNADGTIAFIEALIEVEMPPEDTTEPRLRTLAEVRALYHAAKKEETRAGLAPRWGYSHSHSGPTADLECEGCHQGGGYQHRLIHKLGCLTEAIEDLLLERPV